MIEWLMDTLGAGLFDGLASLISLGLVAVLGFVARWIKALGDDIKNKTVREGFYFAISELHSVLTQAVKIVEETFVKKRKENGEWNEDTQAQALQLAITKVRKMLSKQSLKILERFLGKFEDWAEDMVEGKNIEMKDAKKNYPQ